MTGDELKELIQTIENIPMLARYVAKNPELLSFLLKIAKSDEPYAWRALWIADKIQEQNPTLLIPFLPEMTDLVLKTDNPSKKRHLLKLISQNKITEERLTELLNFSIDRFTDASEPVAVRVHALQVLFNIASEQTAFSGELIELIEHEMECHGSPGLNSRGRKLLQQLRKQQKNPTV